MPSPAHADPAQGTAA
uniref:Uncharacterized protein n=1 Tax=Arundo donax TaxID=35708 RepID=A0A0A9FYG4_ARUDO